MNSKKVKSIVWVIILVIIIGAMAYYFWPKGQSQPAADNGLFNFKVMRNDLLPEEKDKYLNDFNLTKEALANDPNDFYAMLNLGMIKKYIGDYEGAELAWVKAGELQPKNSTSFGNLADLYANFLKDYNQAIPAYQTAIANSMGEEKNLRFYRSFAEFYLYYLKDDKKAEEILLDGIKNNPTSGELMVVLGNFYRDKGEKQNALEYYQKAYKLDPTNTAISAEIKKLQ
jgi:cytochrome c-type biogenesis protein CcmH/NrfG